MQRRHKSLEILLEILVLSQPDTRFFVSLLNFSPESVSYEGCCARGRTRSGPKFVCGCALPSGTRTCALQRVSELEIKLFQYLETRFARAMSFGERQMMIASESS